MISPLSCPTMNYGVLLASTLTTLNPLTVWLTFGKLPENPVITPNTTTQVITPSAINRYLESVTVNPIPTTPGG
jgi:hypothetical protein